MTHGFAFKIYLYRLIKAAVLVCEVLADCMLQWISLKVALSPNIVRSNLEAEPTAKSAHLRSGAKYHRQMYYSESANHSDAKMCNFVFLMHYAMPSICCELPEHRVYSIDLLLSVCDPRAHNGRGAIIYRWWLCVIIRVARLTLQTHIRKMIIDATRSREP